MLVLNKVQLTEVHSAKKQRIWDKRYMEFLIGLDGVGENILQLETTQMKLGRLTYQILNFVFMNIKLSTFSPLLSRN